MHDNNFRRAFSVRDVCDVAGLGRTTVYAAIKTGQLVARKAGTRTIILAADLEAWLQGLPTVPGFLPDSAPGPTRSPASSDTE